MEMLQSLSSLSSTIETSNSNDLLQLQTLIAFMRNFSTQLESFSNSISIPEMPQKAKSKLSINIQLLYEIHKNLKNILLSVSNKIKSEILSSLQNYEKELIHQHERCKKNLTDYLFNVKNESSLLTQTQKDYYKEYENIVTLENESAKNQFQNEQEIKEYSEKVKHQTKVMNEKRLMYQTQIDVSNKIFKELEKDFLLIMLNFTKIEENKLVTYKKNIEDYLNILNCNLNVPFNNELSALINIFKKYNQSEDLAKYKETLGINDSQNSQIEQNRDDKNININCELYKFKPFEFTTYDEYVAEKTFKDIKKDNATKSKTNTGLQNTNFLFSLIFPKCFDDSDILLLNCLPEKNEGEEEGIKNNIFKFFKKKNKGGNIYNSVIEKNNNKKEDFQIDSSNIYFDMNNENEMKDILIDIKSNKLIKESIINNFFEKIFEKEEINVNLLNKTQQVINNSLSNKSQLIEFNRIFINEYYKKTNKISKGKSYIKFLNFNNFSFFNSILQNMIMNLNFEVINNNISSFNFLAILLEIGEKTYYENTYSCALLSKYNILDSKNLWFNLTIYYLKILLEYKIQKYKAPNPSKKQKIINSISNLIQTNNSKEKLPLEDLKLDNLINGYHNLSFNKKQIINFTHVPNFLNSAVKTSIIHMTNYNYKIENMSELIMEIYQKFNLNEIYFNYFFNYMNTSSHTIKKFIQNGIKNDNKNNENQEQGLCDVRKLTKATNKKNEFLEKKNFILDKTNSSYENLNIKYSTMMVSNKEKFIVLKNIYKYCDNKDILKLIFLNKDLSKQLKIKIYKYLLKSTKNDLNSHIVIWKTIFKTVTFKKLFNYQQILNDLQKTNDEKTATMIDLDVKRSTFKTDKIEGRKAIKNILSAFVFIQPAISYCQGINYIASFLFEITKSEEEAFYLLVGLFSYSNYKLLIIEDMQKLKKFYYVLRRLIYLYMPEISYYFNVNAVYTRFFTNSFFITLFTNCYPYVDDVNSYVLVKIWDDFLIYGFDSLFSDLLAVIYCNHDTILNTKSDDLISFMVNDLPKSDIFKNENYEKFLEVKEKFIMEEGMIRDLEDEIDYKMKVDSNVLGYVDSYDLDDEEI